MWLNGPVSTHFCFDHSTQACQYDWSSSLSLPTPALSLVNPLPPTHTSCYHLSLTTQTQPDWYYNSGLWLLPPTESRWPSHCDHFLLTLWSWHEAWWLWQSCHCLTLQIHWPLTDRLPHIGSGLISLRFVWDLIWLVLGSLMHAGFKFCLDSRTLDCTPMYFYIILHSKEFINLSKLQDVLNGLNTSNPHRTWHKCRCVRWQQQRSVFWMLGVC